MSWSVSMPSCFVAKSENPLMIGNQSIYRDKKVEVFREGEDLVLMFTQPHVLRIPIQDRQAIDDEVIRMLRMRTKEGRKYFTQQEVGKIIGVSRQMINRRWQVYRKRGWFPFFLESGRNQRLHPSF